jgi:hypothetical protein
MWVVYLLGVLTWAIVMGYSGFIHHDWNDCFASTLAWIEAVAVNEITINLLKVLVGRPRPNFWNNPVCHIQQ